MLQSDEFYRDDIAVPDENHMLAVDGAKLYTKRDLPLAPQAVVVIAHGLAEHLDRYDSFTNYLVRHSFAVYRFDQRGHGRSTGERGAYGDYNHFADDIKAVVDWARSENHHLSVFALGHSMGGGAVMEFGTKYPGYVDGIISVSAVTRYNKHIFGPFQHVDPNKEVPNALGDGINTCQAVKDDYVNDPLNLKMLKGSIINAMIDMIKYVTDNAKQFTDPVLILHGQLDGLVSPKDSMQSWLEIGSKDKELHIYPKLMHEILNEPSLKHSVYYDIVRWMKLHMF